MAEGGSEVPSMYLCPICRDVFKKPTQTRECNHRFCESCLWQTRASDNGALLCPICRHPFLIASSFHDKEFELEMKKTNFKCYGCLKKLSLTMYNGHQNTCKKRSRDVPQFEPVAPSSHSPQVSPNRSTFHCPLCEQSNFDSSGLLEHVNKYHANSSKPVVCPICAAMPWGNPDQRSGNFVRHLNLRHRFEYETYVDYGQDEDTVLQAALQASLSDT